MNSLDNVQLKKRDGIVYIPANQFREYQYLTFKGANRNIEWNNGTILFKFAVRLPLPVNDLDKVYKLIKHNVREISPKNIVIVEKGRQTKKTGNYDVEIYIKHPEHPMVIEVEDILSMVEFIFINN